MVSGNYPGEEARGTASVRLPTRFLLCGLDGPRSRFGGAAEVPTPKHHRGNANGSKAVSWFG